MSSVLISILEGYKKGHWQPVEPYTINTSYDFDRINSLIGQICPLQKQLHQLKESGISDDDPNYFDVFYELHDKVRPLEKTLEILIKKPPVKLTDAFSETGSGSELKAILGVDSDTSVRSCEHFRSVESKNGFPEDCSELLRRYYQWSLIRDNEVRENLNNLSKLMRGFNVYSINVRDLIKFDWETKILRYCYVKADILPYFGDGNKYIPYDLLLKFYAEQKLIFAAACHDPEYFRVNYISTYLGSVGGKIFQKRMKDLNQNFNEYQKQRIIFWAVW